jgi:hypothetical protein
MTENERFGLVVTKTGSINSGTAHFEISKKRTILYQGKGFKNLQKTYSLALGFLFFVISISEDRVNCTAHPDVLVEVAGGGEAPAAEGAPVRRTVERGRGQGLRLPTALVKAVAAALLH